MIAQIIAIGDEILIGQTLDTNSNFLAAELTKLGFTVKSISAISDEENAIIEALNSAINSDLTIMTGGLGPTKDDITKSVLTRYFDTELEFNETAFNDVCEFIGSLNSNMNPLNRDQALFPKSAEIIRNKQGTAPGMWFNKNNKITVSLPGVPFEMKSIFQTTLNEKIRKHFNLQENYYQSIMISGIGESQLALDLEQWQNNLPKSVSVAYLPSPGVINLRLGMSGDNTDSLKENIKSHVVELQKIVPEYIFSIDGESLEVVVGKLLKNNDVKISTAESCTGGNIARKLTSVPGSSVYFKGSIIAYANEIKEQKLHVSNNDIENFGAVSKQVVEQMAIGVKKVLNTDFSIATSGIAGPDGGTKEKPVGTVWIAVSGPNGTISKEFRFGNRRDVNILRSTVYALNMLRQELIIY